MPNRHRSQKERLLGHLRRQWVSPLTALQLVGCLSLSQRCGELRREGHKVIDRWEEVFSKTGKNYTKRVKSYRIAP